MAQGFAGESFQQVYHFEHGGTGDGSHSDSPLPMTDATLWSIPAGTLVEKVYVIIDSAVSGTTDLDVGDDDNADGYVDGSLSLTLGTPGMYGYDAKTAGAYLRVETAGATDPADIYVVPQAKYYSVGTKSLSADFTGTSAGGALRVVVEGKRLVY